MYNVTINKKSVSKNIFWLFIDKILRAGLTLLINLLMARHFGKNSFGVWSYSLSFVMFVSILSSSGIKEIVIRDLALAVNPKIKNFILGSAFVIRNFMYLLFSIALIFLIKFLHPNNAVILQITFFLLLANSFQFSEIFDFDFQSKLQSKYTVYGRNSAFIIVSLIRIYCIFIDSTLITFTFLVIVEMFLAALIMLLFYQKDGSVLHWRYNKKIATKMIWDGLPLLVSGVGVLLYMRIDQVMIGELIGIDSVGSYAAIVNISEVAHAIPLIIGVSLQPWLIKARQENYIIYREYLQIIFEIMVRLGILWAIFMTLFGGLLVRIFLGNAYVEATNALLIHSWSYVFIFSGYIATRWLIIEGFLRLIFWNSLIAASTSILLNIILIPKLGIIGCSISTIFSQAIASYFIYYIFKESREIFLMQTEVFIKLFSPSKNIALWKKIKIEGLSILSN